MRRSPFHTFLPPFFLLGAPLSQNIFLGSMFHICLLFKNLEVFGGDFNIYGCYNMKVLLVLGQYSCILATKVVAWKVFHKLQQSFLLSLFIPRDWAGSNESFGSCYTFLKKKNQTRIIWCTDYPCFSIQFLSYILSFLGFPSFLVWIVKLVLTWKSARDLHWSGHTFIFLANYLPIRSILCLMTL